MFRICRLKCIWSKGPFIFKQNLSCDSKRRAWKKQMVCNILQFDLSSTVWEVCSGSALLISTCKIQQFLFSDHKETCSSFSKRQIMKSALHFIVFSLFRVIRGNDAFFRILTMLISRYRLSFQDFLYLGCCWLPVSWLLIYSLKKKTQPLKPVLTLHWHHFVKIVVCKY